MRSQEDVEHRLRKLTDRYRAKLVASFQRKAHRNCLYNQLHTPTPRSKADSSKAWESSLAPRHQVTLIVIQPDRPIGICMHGSERADTWNGDTCDDDETAEACPKFRAIQTREGAEAEFSERLKDDEHVLAEYPDIAALQWALDARVWSLPPDPAEEDAVAQSAAFMRSMEESLNGAVAEAKLIAKESADRDIADIAAAHASEVAKLTALHESETSRYHGELARVRDELRKLSADSDRHAEALLLDNNALKREISGIRGSFFGRLACFFAGVRRHAALALPEKSHDPPENP
jgi:hypothetical protein